jgi:hypothetical protein
LRAERAQCVERADYAGEVSGEGGIFSDCRGVFWRMAKPSLKKGDIESVIHVSFVAHHMISLRAKRSRDTRTLRSIHPKWNRIRDGWAMLLSRPTAIPPTII